MGPGGLTGRRLGEQKRCHRVGEAIRVFPEEQMAQLRDRHQPGTRDAVREQLSVARVDDGVRAAVQDQRACLNARLPQAPRVPCSRGSLGRPGAAVGRPGALELDQAVDDFRILLAGPRRQRIFRVAAQRRPGRQAGRRRDQPHGGRGHPVGERPARCGAGQNETVDSLRVGDGHLLGHHAAQAHPHDVCPADPGGIEHGNDIAGHVGHAERTGRPVAAPGTPVIHQYQPEAPPQFPQHRLPPETVEAHPLNQDQPRPPAHRSAQLVRDPQPAARRVPGPAQFGSSGHAARPVHIVSIC